MTAAEKIKSLDTNEMRDRIKRIGEASATPFLDLLSKYQNSAIEVLETIEEGLNEAYEKLQVHPNETTRLVANQFSLGAKWLNKLHSSLKNGKSEDLIDIIEREGNAHPEALFAMSVLTGLFLGRLGRYTAHVPSSDNSSNSKESNYNEQSNLNLSKNIDVSTALDLES